MSAIYSRVTLGGDTDTIAKIIGDLVGAMYGIEWIPEEWRGVEGEDELIKLGEQIYEISNSQ